MGISGLFISYTYGRTGELPTCKHLNLPKRTRVRDINDTTKNRQSVKDGQMSPFGFVVVNS